MKLTLRTTLLLVAVGFSFSPSFGQTNNPPGFGHLKQPRITAKPAQNMLVVEAKGDPNIMGGQAFGLLFQLYYRLQETPKGPLQAFPRARWPEDLATPKNEWTGFYAMPVPESVGKLPEHQSPPGVQVSLAKWNYGEVAEILHVGPYSQEAATMQRLKKFVTEQGYRTVGGHEEEYIVGPTDAGKGDPEKYVTIIRFCVRKAEPK